jgi:hypothetical protein
MATPKHPWTDNPQYGDEGLRIPSPKLLPLFQQLVRRAKLVQHGSLTARQYQKLQVAFMQARKPLGSPIFGWYYSNRRILHQSLSDEGIRIRLEAVPQLHRYKLRQMNFKRLIEMDYKIQRRSLQSR